MAEKWIHPLTFVSFYHKVTYKIVELYSIATKYEKWSDLLLYLQQVLESELSVLVFNTEVTYQQ